MTTKIKFLLLLAIIGLAGCKTSQLIHASSAGNELFKVAILYPSGEGKTFDMDYYESKHMPMVAALLGKNLQFYEIDKGIAGRTPTDQIPFLAIGYFYVKDVTEYNKVIAENIQAIISDIKKYTNIQPVIQISDVRRIGFNKVK